MFEGLVTLRLWIQPHGLEETRPNFIYESSRMLVSELERTRGIRLFN